MARNVKAAAKATRWHTGAISLVTSKTEFELRPLSEGAHVKNNRRQRLCQPMHVANMLLN